MGDTRVDPRVMLRKARQESYREAVIYLNENRNTPVAKAFMTFLDMCLEEARMMNDSADSMQVVKNQGEISFIKRMQGILISETTPGRVPGRGGND